MSGPAGYGQPAGANLTDPRLTVLLDAAFPDSRPPLLGALGAAHHVPARFDVGVLVCSAGGHRVYLADRPDPAAWDRAVRAAAPGASRLLNAAPAGCRRMVDTDGQTHEVYLDDLQAVRPDLGLMALVWSSASERVSRVRFVSSLPPAFASCTALAGGRLAIRTGDGPAHLLWVSEAAHTGDVAGSWSRAEAAVALPPLVRALRARVPGLYVDALDLHATGQVDVTLGLLPTTAEAPG